MTLWLRTRLTPGPLLLLLLGTLTTAFLAPAIVPVPTLASVGVPVGLVAPTLAAAGAVALADPAQPLLEARSPRPITTATVVLVLAAVGAVSLGWFAVFLTLQADPVLAAATRNLALTTGAGLVIRRIAGAVPATATPVAIGVITALVGRAAGPALVTAAPASSVPAATVAAILVLAGLAVGSPPTADRHTR